MFSKLLGSLIILGMVFASPALAVDIIPYANTTVINTSRAVSTNWFSTDVAIVQPRNSRPVKHTLLIWVASTDTVVNFILTTESSTMTMTLNEGNALNAGSMYIFEVIVPNDATYNLQHNTATQNVTCIITESVSPNVG